MKRRNIKVLMVRIFSLLLIFSSSFVNAQEIQLTFSPNDHFNPRFSPGGRWILYQRAVSSGDSLIYKISSAGGTEILLSSLNTSAFNPNWSRDGEWICYEKRGNTGYKQIFIARADGSQEQAITNSAVEHLHPEFSPDGKWLAYFRRVTGFGFQIFKISVSKPREEIHLADFQHACNVPRWSPDGSWLLYQERDSVITSDSVNVGVWRLYKLPSTGGTEQRLTHTVALHEDPDWSPDGQWITYEFRQDILHGFSQIFRVAVTGGEEIPLTFDEAMHESPRWSPDGEWIAYEKRGGTFTRRQIYRIHWSGGEEIPVTSNDRTNHYQPDWSPDGNWIVYIRQDENRQFQIYKSSVVSAVEYVQPAAKFTIFAQNYPNPFNSQTTIQYQISAPNHVSIILYDLLGKEVRRLVDAKHTAGEYLTRWDGRNQMGEIVSSGIYFCLIKTPHSNLIVKRLIYLR